jgi:mRNA deadenylase 3'-5' endonuclease subunit Ccr4
VDHFEDFYEPLFQSVGMESVYYQRPTKTDGCLIAFRKDQYQLKYVDQVSLNDVAFGKPGGADKNNNKYIKNNVALSVVLSNLESKTDILVSTCHVNWNPSLPDVKLAQVQYILQRLAKLQHQQQELKQQPESVSDQEPDPERQQEGNQQLHASTSTTSSSDEVLPLPTILCGDFNSFPNSEIYNLGTLPSLPLRSAARLYWVSCSLSPCLIFAEFLLSVILVSCRFARFPPSAACILPLLRVI